MFERTDAGAGGQVGFFFEGSRVEARAGDTVAAAILAHGERSVRTTPASGAPRGPFCFMGTCFECLVEIDGVPNRQACMVVVAEGMDVRRQEGAREATP
ncbi:(2Fe-2S)-binding protein [Lutibaculum baratangense]|uniref:Opine oxidase subunit C n=1 Tax=Lutibaculum baratangense AMV1 TaxID=631454 RepID=V4RQ82_9HYPH|nr:(2Fe-2S)-binding protein [Lutibaculum baratangense]ESR27389.1 Opine oxidase subunit C [Lutibaculum baratangense AMV1]